MPLRYSASPALSLLCFFLAACAGQESGATQAPLAQRVILITCDTLRADRLGVYGYEGETSPNLDAFAKHCVVYDKAYASAPMTMPAMASMMTGLLPDHTGVVDNHVLIPSAATTLAEALSDAGFVTSAVVSNWVLKSRDAGLERGMQQGFGHFDDSMQSEELTRKKVKERLAPDTTDAALAWLKARTTDRFFLWVHYQDPHGPYTPPEHYVQPIEREYARRLAPGATSNTPGNIPNYQLLGKHLESDFYLDRYEAEIRFFDHELGRLLAALEAESLFDDALVIFTADHGESLGEHDWWFSHGQTLYNELVLVPMLVRYPGLPTGDHMHWQDDYRRTSMLVGHLDLFATVLASVGLGERATHGVSLFDLKPDVGRVLSQSVREEGDGLRWQGATDGRWRWLQSAKQEFLFDLQNDPGELNNLISEKADQATRLRAQFERDLSSLPALGERASKALQSVDDQQDLKALGYFDEAQDDAD